MILHIYHRTHAARLADGTDIPYEVSFGGVPYLCGIYKKEEYIKKCRGGFHPAFFGVSFDMCMLTSP